MRRRWLYSSEEARNRKCSRFGECHSNKSCLLHRVVPTGNPNGGAKSENGKPAVARVASPPSIIRICPIIQLVVVELACGRRRERKEERGGGRREGEQGRNVIIHLASPSVRTRSNFSRLPVAPFEDGWKRRRSDGESGILPFLCQQRQCNASSKSFI